MYHDIMDALKNQSIYYDQGEFFYRQNCRYLSYILISARPHTTLSITTVVMLFSGRVSCLAKRPS